MILFRFEGVEETAQPLAYVEERVRFPLQSAPDLEQITMARAQYERDLTDARERNAGDAERFGLAYHAKWARVMEAAWRSLHRQSSWKGRSTRSGSVTG